MARFFATHVCSEHCRALSASMPGEAMTFEPQVILPEAVPVFAPPVPNNVAEKTTPVPSVGPTWVEDNEFYSCAGVYKEVHVV